MTPTFSRRDIWRALALTTSALTVLGTSACAQTLAKSGASPSSTKKPNILIILVDDLKPAIAAYGDKAALTPHMDRLFAQGAAFDHAYANQAVCAPSRFNLMTGARSTSTGIYDFGMNLRDYVPDAVTLPQYFQANGYHTESLGKVYHVGHGTKADDKGWSVPAHKDHVIEYVDPASTNGKATQEEVLFNEVPVEDIDNIFAYARTLPRGAAWESPDVDDEAYADGRIAKRASERLKALADKDAPFMMMVGFARPHLPFSVPLKYWNLYDPAKLPMPQTNTPPLGAPVFAGKVGGEIAAYEPIVAGQTGKAYPESLTRKLIHGYYAGVSYMDAQLGKVMQALDDTGLSDNTIVVLWGDHGYHLGDHGFWTKHTNYEQAARIPLIFRGPGIKPQVSHQLSETVDIYPTLAALAGLSRPAGPQPIDGIDLSGVLHGSEPELRAYSYHCFNRMTRIGQAIRTPRYRLVRWTNESNGAVDYELYDYEADPLETRNLASAHPDVVAKLEVILNAQPKPVSVQLKAQRNRQAQQPAAAINN